MSDVAGSRPRLGELDALRGICALFVGLFHYTMIYPARFGPDDGLGFDLAFGHLGPHLFFVISGFAMWLSTEHLPRERGPALVAFAWTRFLRLFPAFWFACCLTFVLINLVDFPDHRRSFSTFLLNLTMVPAAFDALTLDAAYWSLAVELVFYGWVAAIMVLRLRPWVDALVLTWLACKVAYWVHVAGGGYFPWRLTQLVLTEYGNLFLAGIVLCRIWQRQMTAWTWVALAGCLLIEWLPNLRGHGYPFPLPEWHRPVIVSGFLLLVLCVTNTERRVFAWSPLLFMGRISYTFYLVHSYTGFVIIMGLLSLGVPGLLAVASAIIGSGLLAWGVTVAIEEPLQRWRSLFASRRSDGIGRAQ